MQTNNTARGNLLCLKYRSVGHIVNECPYQQWSPGDGWFFSEARRGFDFERFDSGRGSHDLVCVRCRDIDVLKMLHDDIPWRRTSNLDEVRLLESPFVKNLGKTGAIELFENCGLCCCLFAMAPGPSSADQDILLFPFWTMSRLAGEDDLFIDTAHMELRYAKNLMVVLHDTSEKRTGLTFSTISHRGDALCIVQKNLDNEEMLGGRVIHPHDLGTKLVKQWVSLCINLHHVECSPVWTEELQTIRLIDVSDERKAIQYPYRGCEYIALSYVWGEGVQQGSFKCGASIPKNGVPQTIEDAMSFARAMGKRYLWVDSICIDQADQVYKDSQIIIMKSIYRGAYLTLIAMSAKSANEGLPKLGSKAKLFPQMCCHINGKHLVGLMPTLSQQIWKMPWGQRAWTLQEALLSPRCLYITGHQLHYECNAMQCCESLDERDSFSHRLPHDEVDTSQAFWRHERVGAGCLRNITSRPSHRLTHYNRKLTLYRYRSMTYDRDVINAFLGILQHLEVFYTKGFYQGLPIEDLQWGLLWRARQPNPPRCAGYPSWSWAGWKGPIWPGQPFDEARTNQFPVHLQIWMVTTDGKLERIFHTTKESGNRTSELEAIIGMDPVTEAAKIGPESVVFNSELRMQGFSQNHIFIEAIFFHFSAKYTAVHQITGEDVFFAQVIGGVRCLIRIMRTDAEWQSAQSEQDFVLLGRDKGSGYIWHHLLLLKYPQNTTVAMRGTIIALLIPLGKLKILEELQPRKQQIALT